MLVKVKEGCDVTTVIVFVSIFCSFIFICSSADATDYMIQSHEMNEDRTLGSSINFLCNVNAPLKAMNHKAYWLHEGRLIADLGNPSPLYPQFKHGYKDQSTIFLKIDPISMKDAGAYKCQINIIFNDVDSKELSQTHILVVMVPPKLKPFENTSISLSEGSSYSVKCELTDGLPPPEITWFKQAPTFDGDDDYGIPQENETLWIERATLEDGGIYTCMALNRAGNVRQSIVIKILHRPLLIDASPSPIHSGPGYTTVLFCIFYAAPNATVQWHFKGRIIQLVNVPNNRFQASIQKIEMMETYRYVLTITKMNITDFGTYECVARNKLGPNKDRKLIEVSAKPAMLKIISLSHNNTYSDRYTLEWSVASYSHLTSFHALIHLINGTKEIVYQNITIEPNNLRLPLYYSTITETKENYHQSAVITNLPESSKFSIQMMAVNKYGATDWTDVGYFQTVAGGRSSAVSSVLIACAALLMALLNK
ncbi:hypothetical protein HELRODRAFT_194990 [Helobdella robusta]|uniref:Ig-like domain-containing protein n=1 Tax=Helobdella robusta TaxID=6412 RepID=T1FWM6_HELRO|nr:hypothetical protein HELRODRAFT_194990 [Helobdella robusta]ESO09826.1 hypothetical protein HELRODRAFT_194990 [Helobdella robusta]